MYRGKGSSRQLVGVLFKEPLSSEACLGRVAHAGTPDPAFVKDYTDALAVIARRQLSKKSSGGDDGAEPPRNKHHC